MTIQPQTLQCLRQRVGQELRRLIISGKLRPGQRIIQQRLARQMGVSQSVVREAMLEMQCTGLVESVDNLGMFVSAIVWALSAHSGNYHHASAGRRGTIVSAVAAFLVGAAPAIVNFFENLGRTVH